MHSDEPSNTQVSKRNTKTRKNSNSTLDDAIEKQKNFLNGFVKKIKLFCVLVGFDWFISYINNHYCMIKNN